MVVVGPTVVAGIDVVVGGRICTDVDVLELLEVLEVLVDDGVVGGYASAMIGDTRVIANITPTPARQVDTRLRRTLRCRSSLPMNTQSNDQDSRMKCPDQRLDRP